VNARYVYAVWTGLGGSAAFARSTDGGVTWSVPNSPCGGCAANDNNVIVLPDGSVADIFIWNNGASSTPYAITISPDRGLTWSAPAAIVTPAYAPGSFKTSVDYRAGGFSEAVDPNSGVIYLVWQDGRFNSSLVNGIAMSRSTDGGVTWSAPIQVNQATNAWAFNASVAVAKDGTIGVTYYDFRNDGGAPGTLLANYWLIESSDGGATWSERELAGPFDIATAPQSEAGAYFLGDYEGLAAAGDGFLAFFAATSQGGAPGTSSLFSAFAPRVVTPRRR